MKVSTNLIAYDMATIKKSDLLKAQQGEIDAVIVYHKLADRIANKDSEIHKKLMSIGSDEGKHANMLRKLTGEVRNPKSTLANIVVCLTYLIGKKRTLLLMAKAEHKALETYKPFVEQYPELEPMRLDEEKHGNILDNIANEL